MLKLNKCFAYSILLLSVGCGEEEGTQPELIIARDYIPENAPEVTEVELDSKELTLVPEGTTLVYTGNARVSQGFSASQLAWVFPNGSFQTVELDSEASYFPPFPSSDRRTLLLPEVIDGETRHRVIRITDEGFSKAVPAFSSKTHFIEKPRFFSYEDDYFDWSNDGRFFGVWTQEEESENWVFRIYDFLTTAGQQVEVYESTPLFEPTRIKALNGYAFSYVSGVRTADVIQLTNTGTIGPKEISKEGERAQLGANGFFWSLENEALGGTSIYVEETLDSERVEISNLESPTPPFPVGDGSNAYLQQQEQLYLLSATGEEKVAGSEMDLSVPFIPFLDGVAAQKLDGSWSYFDQLGREEPLTGQLNENVDATVFRMSNERIESGHLLRVDRIDGNDRLSYVGLDGNQLTTLEPEGVTRYCASPNHSIPFDKAVHVVEDSRFNKTELIFIDLSTPTPLEIGRLKAKEGYELSCPAFSPDGKRVFVAQSKTGEPAISQQINWNSSEDFQVGPEKSYEDVSFMTPVVVF